MIADSILALMAIAILIGVLWGYQERRIKELRLDKVSYKILSETLTFVMRQQAEEIKSLQKQLKTANKSVAKKPAKRKEKTGD